MEDSPTRISVTAVFMRTIGTNTSLQRNTEHATASGFIKQTTQDYRLSDFNIGHTTDPSVVGDSIRKTDKQEVVLQFFFFFGRAL